MDYQIDRSGGSSLALCLHCHERIIRAEARSAVEAICRHLYAAHDDDPGIRRRLGRR